MIKHKLLIALLLSLTLSFYMTSRVFTAEKKPVATKTATKKIKTPKLKALLITGGCCHDYATQIKILTEGISQRASVEWTVEYVKSRKGTAKVPIYSKKDWAKGYDIIVHNECFAHVNDVQYIESVTKVHADGTPGIFIHCAMHCYRSAKTDQWRKMLGVTSTNHERGGRSLDVMNLKKEHPVMKGFPDKWKTPSGELYKIKNIWPKCTPLAHAYGQDTKKNHICIWTNTYGKTRIFGTTLGHHNSTMKAGVYLDFISRGLLWSCNKLDENGKPLVGYEGTGIGPLSIDKPRVSKGSPTLASWADSVKFPKEEKKIALFNGKDLTGWEGHKKYWSVKDGEIIGKNTKKNAPKASTYLFTKKEYRNFRLVFEAKVESKVHSGLALWGKKFTSKGDPLSYQGHLVMFPGVWGFYDLYRRSWIYRDDGRAQKADNKDWNKMEILAIGNRIQLAVNGKMAADWKDPKPEFCKKGPIALQLHALRVAQAVRFRGLILSENPQDKMITVQKKK